MNNIFRFILCVFASILFGISCLASESNLQKVSDTNGTWNLYWRGAGSVQGSAYNLPGAGACIARALDIAEEEKLPDFAACFLDADTNSPSERVKDLYKEWNLVSRQYHYIIATEATLSPAASTNLTNVISAVSVVPAMRRLPKVDFSNTPPLQVRVVFAMQMGKEWKLLQEPYDNQIANFLLNRDSRYLYHPVLNVFSNEYQAKDAFKAEELKNQAKIINEWRSRNARPEEINGMIQKFQFSNAGKSVRTWQEWTNYFNPRVLNPPLVFDEREPYPFDFTSPVAAYKSYNRALFVGDSKTLLDHADETGRAWLKRQLGVDESHKQSTYESLTKMTSYTILLTATNTFEGNNYVLLLARNQENVNPKLGHVAFDVMIFRDMTNSFFISRDLDFTSDFGGVVQAARANGANLFPYSQFYEKVKQSEFPPYFYTIE